MAEKDAIQVRVSTALPAGVTVFMCRATVGPDYVVGIKINGVTYGSPEKADGAAVSAEDYPGGLEQLAALSPTEEDHG